MKLIPLSRGFFAKVDDEDYADLSQFKWYALKNKHTFYAVRNHARIVGVAQVAWMEYMHRRILGITERRVRADHRNGDGLDNQRHNLRRSTPSQNNGNNRRTIAKSGYKGVCTSSNRNGKWRAQIKIGKKTIHLGEFPTKKEAAVAYDRAAIRQFGEFACTNADIHGGAL